MNRQSFLTASVGVALGASCACAGAADKYETISGSNAPLRSAFNHDVDKVRIVMLVSPT